MAPVFLEGKSIGSDQKTVGIYPWRIMDDL
jgi:hypothetical protein